MDATALTIFGFCAGGVFSVLFLYPMAAWLRSAVARDRSRGQDESAAVPSVSILVAGRNAETLLPQKIENVRQLRDPGGGVQAVWVSDGSTDRTAEILRESVTEPDVAIVVDEHRGKASALNRGAEECTGEILVFSDADAILEVSALEKLVARFEDPTVGGVCGRRTLGKDRTDLTSAQSGYVNLDSRVKQYESRWGSITSNDGKLYASRRELLRSVEEAVTDDLWVALNVIDQGYRFVFEPGAIAWISTPSRSPGHELRRRRRIVSRSLRGLARMRQLMNPLRTGFFAIGLFVNKVLRRALPFFLLGMLVSSVFLALESDLFRVLALVQGAGILLAAGYPMIRRLPVGPLARLSSLPFYFSLGMLGTALGVLDFVRGRRVVVWDPQKSGSGS